MKITKPKVDALIISFCIIWVKIWYILINVFLFYFRNSAFKIKFSQLDPSRNALQCAGSNFEGVAALYVTLWLIESYKEDPFLGLGKSWYRGVLHV